jgi:hypothetical protein
MLYGGLELVIVPLTLLGVVVLSILALAGGRAEPDTGGRRAYVLYLSLVSFVALFTVLFAAMTTTAAIANMAFKDTDSVDCSDPYNYSPECYSGSPGSEEFGLDPSFSDAEEARRARDAITGAAVGIAAAIILLLHRRKTRELLNEPDFGSSPGARTFTAYLYAVSFTAVVILLAAVAMALLALVRVAIPDVVTAGSSGAERDDGLVQLVPSLVVAGGALLIYVTHWRVAGRLRGGTPPRPAPEPRSERLAEG